jgi:hypothetical protein
MTNIAGQPKSRVNAGIWLVIGVLMASMYVVNGIQASSGGYFFAALGWVVLGATQAWRALSGAPSSDAPKNIRNRYRLSLFVTILAFLLIAGGMLARWA